MSGHLESGYYLVCVIDFISFQAYSHLTPFIASEDGTSRIWDRSSKNKCHILAHTASDEVLRNCFIRSDDEHVCAATAGAEGSVKVWSMMNNGKPALVKQLSYGSAQVYACEKLSNSNILLTAADDRVYLWDIDSESIDGAPSHCWHIESQSSKIIDCIHVFTPKIFQTMCLEVHEILMRLVLYLTAKNCHH